MVIFGNKSNILGQPLNGNIKKQNGTERICTQLFQILPKKWLTLVSDTNSTHKNITFLVQHKILRFPTDGELNIFVSIFKNKKQQPLSERYDECMYSVGPPITKCHTYTHAYIWKLSITNTVAGGSDYLANYNKTGFFLGGGPKFQERERERET